MASFTQHLKRALAQETARWIFRGAAVVILGFALVAGFYFLGGKVKQAAWDTVASPFSWSAQKVENGIGHVKYGYGKAREATVKTYDDAVEGAKTAYGKTRDAAVKTYEGAKERVSGVWSRPPKPADAAEEPPKEKSDGWWKRTKERWSGKKDQVTDAPSKQ